MATNPARAPLQIKIHLYSLSWPYVKNNITEGACRSGDKCITCNYGRSGRKICCGKIAAWHLKPDQPKARIRYLLPHTQGYDLELRWACRHMLMAQGERPFAARAVQEMVERMAAGNLRVLALACRRFETTAGGAGAETVGAT